ncbi:MAG: 23S rRNA (adenine(2503)-C(2))-methyltransferase RlmN, partial [Phycisphaerae bacterium]
GPASFGAERQEQPMVEQPVESGPAATEGRRHVLDLDPGELAAWFEAHGDRRFRAKQVIEWIYRHGAADFDAMTNLSKALRETLRASFDVFTSRIARRVASTDGTVKFLLEWPDGATTECVMIPTDTRKTACISSQVGCPVGCRFCASGLDGLQRNLTCGEMVEQVLRVRAEAAGRAPSGEPAMPGDRALTNIVFMGLGEPLANYDNVLRAIGMINAPWGVNIGARKITVSTVGLPKQIRRLADEGLQLNLALSLHAPTDALRQDLIPWAEQIANRDLVDACRYYFETTGREVTLEYLLLDGVNDRQTHARHLARFAGQLRCNVNLIRYNPVDGLPYGRPTGEATFAFQRYLTEHGVNAHVRSSRGLDIDAACGQLRRRNA